MLRNYIKIACKVLLRRKFFTLISLFAVGFTLMVLMTVTAILDHVFRPMAPETLQDRILHIDRISLKGKNRTSNGDPGFAFLDRHTRGLPFVERESFFSSPAMVHSYRNGEKCTFWLKHTDGNFWKILQFHFLEGGPFTEEDDRSARAVAVINEATRNRFFPGRSAFGNHIEADGQRFQIVGVVADVPIFRMTSFADIWVPNRSAKSNAYRDNFLGGYHGIYLARDRQDFPAIRSELQSRIRAVALPDPKQLQELKTRMVTFTESVCEKAFPLEWGEGSPEKMLMLLLLAMVLFMLLPALNLVNLNVSRILERCSEIGVRKAFGASSGVLIGQFVVENVILTLIGGILGFFGSLTLLQIVSNSGLIPYARLQLNYQGFLYAFLLTLFFGLFSGIYPAWRMSRLHPVQALNGGVR